MTVRVRVDGTIVLPTISPVKAEGLTLAELRTQLAKELSIEETDIVLDRQTILLRQRHEDKAKHGAVAAWRTSSPQSSLLSYEKSDERRRVVDAYRSAYFQCKLEGDKVPPAAPSGLSSQGAQY